MYQVIFAFAFGWLIALCAWWIMPQDKGICSLGKISDIELLLNVSSNLEGECYFAENYDAAALQFVRSSKRLGAEIIEMPVGEGLITHVALFQGRPDKYFLHFSGVHGVEAYAGSSVQGASLEYLSASGQIKDGKFIDPSAPTLVFVHAVNPYGFKNSRRTNENNIDLNRNFLTDDEWTFVRNRDPNYSNYVDLDAMLNPTAKPFPYIALNEIHAVFNVLSSVFKHGTTPLKRAMVAGNYHKQKGIGFGGHERSQSVTNLIALVTERLEIPTKAKKVLLVDVHTGLGPSGVDTFLFNATGVIDLESIFPTEKTVTGRDIGGLKTVSFGKSPVTTTTAGENTVEDTVVVKVSSSKNVNKAAEAVGSGYELTIGTTEHFCMNFLAPQLTEKDRLCVTQWISVKFLCFEFGTVNMYLVGKSSIDENYGFFWGNAEEKEYYMKQYKSCFYVETREWKRRVVRRGLKTFIQGLTYMTQQ